VQIDPKQPIPAGLRAKCRLPMLSVSQLSCVRGERRLFSGVDFRVADGELLFLQGRSGAGKTTLLRMICGLTPPVEATRVSPPESRRGEV